MKIMKYKQNRTSIDKQRKNNTFQRVKKEIFFVKKPS
jgi:hypothetical protein